MSDFPTRRLQVVLKLVKNPLEILLNFDLDQCGLGYDGEELYMLPRAARAIESTYKHPPLDTYLTRSCCISGNHYLYNGPGGGPLPR